LISRQKSRFGLLINLSFLVQQSVSVQTNPLPLFKMPKHSSSSSSSSSIDEYNEDEAVERLLMPVAQHTNLLKKAGVKIIPENTMILMREHVFPLELRDFVRRIIILMDYADMTTVMPEHVCAAYESKTKKILAYHPRRRRRRVVRVVSVENT